MSFMFGTKHFQRFCISKRLGGIVVIRIDARMLPMLINQR